ncbi:MAG: tryptophan-rich sensory protein [Clostridia bacterium]|nr:tryptophan-rich sensory protein [Clostridia bacterium]
MSNILKKYKSYIVSVLIALAVGGLSALLTKDNMNIYSQINMPSFAPPPVVFAIVWPILYVLMGISSGGIFDALKGDRERRSAVLTIYGVNLGVNFLWSIIFFNLRAFMFSFIWLLLLAGVIIVMIKEFARVKKWLGYLQIPYLLWVAFAGVLNLAIYMMN